MRLVSIPELAEILNLSAATVRSRIKSGEWPFYPLGERSIRVDVEEIKTLLRSPGKRRDNQPQASAE
jgi:excisionase family DNA binding protein